MEEMGTGPTLLLAMPQMTDPNFNRSVVLLCRHDEEGALGFVLNRPMDIEVADLLEGDFSISGSPSLTAWQGGPVSPERGWLICRELPTRSEEDPEDFRVALQRSFDTLQPPGGYIDLFGFHGINHEKQLEWTKNCMAVAKEFQAAGKIKHIGFSTHAMTTTTINAIETDLFDYVNLHCARTAPLQ